MAKCSECLHWEACSTLFELAIGRTPTANGNRAEEKCPNFKDRTKWVEQKSIKTYADRIRAMSDEELANKMVCTAYYYDWKNDEDYYYFPNGTTKTNYKPKAIEAWLEWLQQPVEGDWDSGQCGHGVRPGDAYCSQCGRKIGWR